MPYVTSVDVEQIFPPYKNIERRMWAKKWLIERKKFSHIILIKELDSDDFRNYLRMDYDCFNKLLNLVSPLILKQNTHMREAVSVVYLF